jgi:hypothetical protein
MPLQARRQAFPWHIPRREAFAPANYDVHWLVPSRIEDGATSERDAEDGAVVLQRPPQLKPLISSGPGPFGRREVGLEEARERSVRARKPRGDAGGHHSRLIAHATAARPRQELGEQKTAIRYSAPSHGSQFLLNLQSHRTSHEEPGWQVS